MTDSGVTSVERGGNSRVAPTRLRRLPLAGAAVLVAAAGGVAGLLGTNHSDDHRVLLPPVVLGESVAPLAVYERGSSAADPDLTLHVRFAMLRHGPTNKTWEVTLVAPDEARTAVAAFNGHPMAVRFNGTEFLLGLSYPDKFDGSAVDFFTIVPDQDTAVRLADAVTTSVVMGPPIGGTTA